MNTTAANTTLSPAHIAGRVAETIDSLFATIDEWRDLSLIHI